MNTDIPPIKDPELAVRRPFPHVRHLAAILAVLFALIAGLALFLFASTPLVPPAYEAYPTVAYKEFGGNGTYLFGLFMLVIGAGFCSMMALIASYSIENADAERRRRY